MKKSFYNLLLSILLTATFALGIFMAERRKIKKSDVPVRVIIDMNKSHGIQKMDGDSVWWQVPPYIVDSADGDISFIHTEQMDTIYGFKNFNPFVVVIIGNDTINYSGFNHDTLRFNECRPDTITKVVYRSKDTYIDKADQVIIGP